MEKEAGRKENFQFFNFLIFIFFIFITTFVGKISE
jgi:hypothetical protein